MKSKSKRVLSGLLATLTLGQNLLCNNAAIITGLTTKASTTKTSTITKEKLINDVIERANELRYSNSDTSGISLFSLFGDKTNNTIDSLNISGYVGLEDNRTAEVSVIIFDDNWNTLAETTVYPNEYFSISANGIKNSTSTTHVKIECNGYLPRFYKDMGFGSYQLGTSDKPEILYFGDTTYNPDAGNQWSDEVISYNDLDFVSNQIDKRKGDENFDDRYDLNHDGLINNDDISIIAEYDGYNYDESTGNLYTNEEQNEWVYIGSAPDRVESILKCDLNGDNIINSSDQQVICDLYPYGAIKGDEDFDQIAYMDINNNDIIDNEDYEYFSNYINIHNGHNPYNDYIYNLTLTGNSSHDSAMYLENTNLDLAEYSLVVDGNFVFRTQNSYNSMWNNNPSVTLNIGNGGLAISGQFDFGQANSYDKIIMTEDAGQLYIWENWNYITLADMEGLWTAGEIGFFGSTWQVNEASGKKSVYSTGTHKIIFGGYANGQQVIRWDNTCETIFNPDTGERNTERTLNVDYKQKDLCLGVLLSKEYTPENYYFRPEIPDYIAYYQDADNNGINDAIDNLFKDGKLSNEEYFENKELLQDFIISNFGDNQEEKEAIAKLISSDNPYKEENTKSIATFIHDGYRYIVNKGNEVKENIVKTYEYAKEVITTVAEEIPDAVEVIYDGARLIISLSPDPICQSIDFVLSVWDVVDDVRKFECTTEWWLDFGIDVLGVVPYIGAAKEFIKTGKTIDKAVDIAKYSKVDGLTGWINQKGLIKTAEKVVGGSADDIPKVFNSVIDDVLDNADSLLKDNETCEILSEFSKRIVKNPEKITINDLNNQINLVKVGIENGKDALNTINTLSNNKSIEHFLSLINRVSTVEDIKTIVDDVNSFKEKYVNNNGNNNSDDNDEEEMYWRLKAMVTDWAIHYADTLENQPPEIRRKRKDFNTATIVYDEVTNKYYYGENGGVEINLKEYPNDKRYEKNPILFGNNGILPKTSLVNGYTIGGCAEVDAINQALNDGSNLKNLHMVTIFTLKKYIKRGNPKKACKNCTYAFEGKIKKNYCNWSDL
ncbi:MAG: hypothetical protein K2K89_06850 [Ruminococcus sp.]|nr:hypothetical protein [Ruminococcus sp.]